MAQISLARVIYWLQSLDPNSLAKVVTPFGAAGERLLAASPITTGHLISFVNTIHQQGLLEALLSNAVTIQATPLPDLHLDEQEWIARPVPQAPIKLLSDLFSAQPQPYLVLDNGEYWETGCFFWSLKPGSDIEGEALQQQSLLSQARMLIKAYPVTVYKGNLSIYHFDLALTDCLVIAGTTDQFDILRIERTESDADTHALVRELTTIDESYGIDLLGAGSASIQFQLRRVPSGEEATKLVLHLLDWSEESFDFRETDLQTDFLSNPIALWWD